MLSGSWRQAVAAAVASSTTVVVRNEDRWDEVSFASSPAPLPAQWVEVGHGFLCVVALSYPGRSSFLTEIHYS